MFCFSCVTYFEVSYFLLAFPVLFCWLVSLLVSGSLIHSNKMIIIIISIITNSCNSGSNNSSNSNTTTSTSGSILEGKQTKCGLCCLSRYQHMMQCICVCIYLYFHYNNKMEQTFLHLWGYSRIHSSLIVVSYNSWSVVVHLLLENYDDGLLWSNW